MPFDFCKMQPYTVDYSDFKTALLSFEQFLGSRNNQVQHIENWIKTIQKLDDSIVSQLDSKEAKANMLRARVTDPELFCIPLSLGKNLFQIHFRVSPLKQLLLEYPGFIEIPATEFLGNLVRWTKEESLGNTPLSVPIIMVPYPIGNHKYLVIDGNHRLSVHLAVGSKIVPAHVLAGKMLIDNSLFACGFDKYLYGMFLEFQCAKECFDSGISDIDILSNSLLHSRDNLFHYAE